MKIVGDTVVKNNYGSVYSDNNKKVFKEPIAEAKSKCIISYIILTIQPKSEATVIYCRSSKLPYYFIVAVTLSTWEHLFTL